MLELYHNPISTCSQRVRMVLAEKAIPWTSRHIQFNTGDHLSAGYLKINPNGVVPTLVHNGEVIVESSVINEYLDEVFPELPLRPHDPLGRARMRSWCQYVEEVPVPSIRFPSFNAYFVPIWRDMTDAQFLQYTERLPLRKHFYRRMGRSGFSDEEIKAALERLEQTLARMEAMLAHSAWLTGQQFSLSDTNVMPAVVRMEDLGLDYLWADKPRVTDWYQRLQARPAFAVAYMPGSRKLGPAC
jgi:glutathione S-transferase